MKTAISLPAALFEQADRLAKRTHQSRNHLLGEALREYVARHAPEEVTEAMDRACAALAPDGDPFVPAAAHRVLEHTKW